MAEQIIAVISSVRDLTPSIREFELTAVGGISLPMAEPGAHIGVETPSGAWRQYSLVTPCDAPTSYRIAIKREDSGRGGSLSVHNGWSLGDEVSITPPNNNFPLGDAPKYLLIAGGIGVTPIYSMAQKLMAQGADLRMIYCTRTGADTAYAEEVKTLLGDRLILHHDDGELSQVYDFWDEFAEPKMQHVYCCGPTPLMEEIKSISGHWPEGRINFEDFAGVAAVRHDDTAFEVTLKKTGKRIEVAADKSILEALRDTGVTFASSCESGTCGTCKCGLVSGDADHRDMVLMDEEKADQIMICVSRAKSGGLVLDL